MSDAERDFYTKAVRLERERHAPGTRAVFQLPDGRSAPGTVTDYYTIGAGLLHVMLDNGETWLVAASRASSQEGSAA